MFFGWRTRCEEEAWFLEFKSIGRKDGCVSNKVDFGVTLVHIGDIFSKRRGKEQYLCFYFSECSI